MKKLLIIAAAALLGCSQSRPVSTMADPSAQLNQHTSPVMGAYLNDYDALYIPDAHEWIDYSHNPFSYHYHGRSRDITPQEKEILETEVLSLVEPDNQALSDKLTALREQYKPLLDQLAKDDEARFKASIQQLIAEKKSEATGETAGK